jgi:hypothetical protein
MEPESPASLPQSAVRAVWLAALQAAERAIAAAAAVRGLSSAELQLARAHLAADREWFATAGPA